MPQLPLMSEDRQRHLLKCAEQTIGLVNGGCGATRALVKVAQDGGLNGHEVDRVSTKVNQALTLAHIQSAPEAERAGPFPLTNADSVKLELFGKKQVESADAARNDDQPQALEIGERQKDEKFTAPKMAYAAPEDFRFAPVVKTLPKFVKTAADLPGEAEKAPSVSGAKIAYEYARESSLRTQLRVDACLSDALYPFSLVYGPSFAGTEKAAAEMGCSDLASEYIFEVGKLAKFGQYRAAHSSVKVASASSEHAQTFVALDAALKVAADALMVQEATLADYRDAQKALTAWHAKVAADQSPVTMNFDGASEQGRGLLDSAMGVDGAEGGVEGAVSDAFGGAAGEESDNPERSLAEKDVDQGMRNTSLRATLQQAMQDPYISGHGVPKVIDSLNRANTLGADLSEAELMSYLRHDLATEGGVPLDLQLRTVQAHSKDGQQ